ncbi:Protein of unknown function [Robiginitalea myxolifaciens]|uniref:DUF2490 domain-containing protein n=1 Tax=Robiginitalea myxolifaciens TaxID=400055 RepID=A0A1I6GYL0_9FLAO|nr:DUF2490 domain-containing protein [Robiginitalea myxolifaciens]SFR47147.1 Protein of unknown function [Robiginitalea myxolifaciens]
MNRVNLRNPMALFLLLVLLLAGGIHNSSAQGEVLPEETEYKDPFTKLWINTYGNIRISKRFIWIAETHFRFDETEETPFVGQIGQIYNRHALSYIYSKYFNVSLGGVLRVNFNTDPDSDGRNVVPEYRIWHQYQFAQPLSSIMVYHRIRIEHRWSQGFADDAEYIYRNRWRYMLRIKVPLNSTKFEPGTWYISPESELIMQSGKEVVGSALEDLRLTTTLGYVLTPRLTIAGGLMYSQGQTLENAGIFKQGFTFRAHLYYSPDFRKVRNKLPAIHLED